MIPVIAIFLRKTYFYHYMLIKQQKRDSRCQYKSRHHTRLKPSFKDIQSSEVQKVPSLIFLRTEYLELSSAFSKAVQPPLSCGAVTFIVVLWPMLHIIFSRVPR